MDRRGFNSPMDWEYEAHTPTDPSSPFATVSRKQNPFASSTPRAALFSPSIYDNPFRTDASIAQKEGRGKISSPFRNPAFTTPKARWNSKLSQSHDYGEDDETVDAPFTTPGAAKPDPAIYCGREDSERSRTGPSGVPVGSPKDMMLQNTKAGRTGEGFEVQLSGLVKQINSDNSVGGGRKHVKNSSRRHKRIPPVPRESGSDSEGRTGAEGRRNESSARRRKGDDKTEDETESSAKYIASGTLLSLFIGGNFYYKVVSVSASVLWVYAVLVFPGKTQGRSREKSARRLGDRMLAILVISAKTMGFLILLIWCVLLTPIQIFVPTPMDAWTKYAEHPPFRSYEVLRHPEYPAIDVFAIHGLGSNPRSAWRYVGNGTEVYWLQDLLPQQEGFENLRIIMINHQTRWDSNSPEADFDVFAKMMLDEIEHLHHEGRPIIFIAHSFGGLLLKRSLVLATNRSKDVARMTKGILFLGVPHFGTKAAFIASLLACTAYWRGSSTTMLEYMAEDNSVVHRLDKEFDEAYAKADSKREFDTPYICNFLEMRPERFGRLSLTPTVNTKSGSLRYGEEVRLDTDHRGLNKFRGSDDPNFDMFLRQFRRALSHAGYDGNARKEATGRRWLGT